MRPASMMAFVVAFLALSAVADKGAMFVGLSVPVSYTHLTLPTIYSV